MTGCEVESHVLLSLESLLLKLENANPLKQISTLAVHHLIQQDRIAVYQLLEDCIYWITLHYQVTGEY